MVSEEDPPKYSLPSDVTQYVNVNFDTYIKEADLIKAALNKNPVPEYIHPVKTLDDFVKDILKDKDFDFNDIPEKIVVRNRSVTGPLSKLWAAVESARISQEDSIEVDLKEIQEFVEQTVLLLGKEFHILLQKILHAVGRTNSPQQSKQMLREDSEFLQKNDENLLGKKFRDNFRHTFKSKKQILDMLSNTSLAKHKFFRHGLPQAPKRSF